MGYEYDYFICHAYEDKDSLVKELVEALRNTRIKVWYDDLSIQIGDNIRQKIDEGISCSRHGVVILSPHFLKKKKWTEHELDGLFVNEDPNGERKIIPIWYDVTIEELMKYSPSIAMRMPIKFDIGIPKIVDELRAILRRRKARGIRQLRVFLCHSSEDKLKAFDLYQRLWKDCFTPWLDEKNLLPGQDWDYEIKRAVRESDVVLVLVSSNSINKAGYVQKEIRQAIEVAEEQPEGAIFIIPVRLEDCPIPERLKQLHWVNYFENDGYDRLVLALEKRESDIKT